MSEISEKLLPCPFCKDEMESFAGLNEGAFARGSDGTFAVNCDCGAMGPAKPTMAEAVTAWNHRAALARAEASAGGPVAWVDRLRSYGEPFYDGENQGTLFKFENGHRFFLADIDAHPAPQPRRRASDG